MTPIGPVGSHIQLNDKKWAVAAEAAVGRLLSTFIVATTEDGRRLQGLCRSIGVKYVDIIAVPRLMTANATTPYHIPESELPRPSLLTLRHVLQTDVAAVHNLLIDQGHIHQSVLIDTFDEADEVAFGRDKTRPRDVNVGAVYMPNGKKLRCSRAVESSLPPDLRRTPRLGMDVTVAIADAQAALETAHQRRPVAEQRRRAAAEVDTKAQAALAQAASRLSYARGALRRARDDLHHMENELAAAALPAADEGEGDGLETLETALAAARAEYGRLTALVSTVEGEVTLGAACRAAADEAASKSAGAAADLSERIDECNGVLDAASAALAKGKHDLEHVLGLRGQMADKLAELQEEAQEARDAVRAKADLAAQLCSSAEAAAAQLPPGASDQPTAEELEAMLCKAERAIEREEKRQKRSYEQVAVELSAKEREVERLIKLILAAKAPALRMRAAYKSRWRLLQKTAKDIQRIVGHNFSRHMQERGHSGTVDLNFGDGLLGLSVTLAGSGAAPGGVQKVTNLRQLSGGERSYTSLCFTLSLNELCDAPFCAMDEWDVFMDTMHRKQSLDKMTAYMKVHKNKQFILLTPLDVGEVDTSENVTISRLKKVQGCDDEAVH